MGVSVVINTINEENNIERVITSVAGFADEIIVVDMESDDNTVKLAKKLGAKVFSHKRTNYVEPARNFAIEKAQGPWILILDADEEAPKTLLKSLLQIQNTDEADFVRIPRKNIIFGKWMKHSRYWPDENIRFFKKGSVVWENEIHSIPVTSGRGSTLNASEDLAIIHHHYESVEQYVDRINRYSTIQAKELFSKQKEVKLMDFISRPTNEFLSRFFAGEGYKDGWHGLVVALLQALSEVVVYSKLWQLYKFPEHKINLADISNEISVSQKDVNYWRAHAKVLEGAGITEKIKRKFKI